MPKQLNVNLAFTADTSQAKRELQDLQRSLNNLTNNISIGNSGALSKEFQAANAQVAQLKANLADAVGSTGSLDLTKFTQNMQKSGTSLKDYQKALSTLGPDGERAFSQLANSISKAEIPLRRTSGVLEQFLVTLKNTARWQISSSLLHGFMGAIQSAYGYAQDLNESLNNIRIVTGYSTDKMAEFAAEANKAARSLSTTTTAYTDAALIYYQQGLNDKEVKERTDVTVKMANVTGESAETVSQQLTAVWNNFYDGSQSLESFSDKMVALGAATASSSSEISAGLNQFAATANTVGLSFDYAAAALATVTATTRQSANVVGNSFKTLFARLEGLSLGETLDDGTTLNKYSAALEKVGISIKDQNGELKAMDTILDELGSRWQTLSKDQQVALAQTVGGVRQYTQLIALMDNWDFMQENLTTARGAGGALEEQAQIYAESWEASKKRVQAALQAIYKDLVDEDFFISLNNFLEKALGYIDKIIEAVGGLPGILATIAAYVTSIFQSNIASSIENSFQNLMMRTGTGRQNVIDQKTEANNLVIQQAQDKGTTLGAEEAEVLKTRSAMQIELIANADKLSEIEQKTAQYLMDQNEELGKQVIKQAEIAQKAEEALRLAEAKARAEMRVGGANRSQKSAFANAEKELKDAVELQVESKKIGSILGQESLSKEDIENINEYYQKVRQIRDLLSKDSNRAMNLFENFTGSADQIGVLKMIQEEVELTENVVEAKKEQYKAIIEEVTGDTEKAEQSTENYTTAVRESAQAEQDLANKEENLKQSRQGFSNFIKEAKGEVYSFADGLAAAANILTSFTALINQIKGLVRIWSDEDATIGEKVVSTLTTVGMMLPMLTRLFSAENKEKLAGLIIDKENIFIQLAKQKVVAAAAATTTASAAAETQYATAEQLATSAAEKEAVAEIKKTLADKSAITVLLVKIGLLSVEEIKEKGVARALWAKVAAQIAANAAMLASLAAIGLVIAGLAIYNNVLKKKQENLEADARAAQESANATNELVESHEEAVTSLVKLQNTIEDYNDLTDEQVKQIQDVNDELDIQNGKLLLLQGRYEDYINTVKQQHLDDIEDNIETNTKNIDRQAAALEGPSGAFTKAKEAIKGTTLANFQGVEGFDKFFSKDEYGHWDVNIDYTNAEDFLDFLIECKKEGKNVEDALSAVNTLVSSEGFASIQESMKIVDTNTISKSLIGADDITSLTSYKELIESIPNDYEDIYKQAIKIFPDLANEFDLLKQVADQSGRSFEEIFDFYNGLETQEEKDLFFKIQWDNISSFQSLDSALEQAQSYLFNSPLQGIIQYQEAAESFKSSASTAEKSAWADNSGIAWGEGDIISKVEFLAMAAEEQEAYLAQLVTQAKEAAVQASSEWLNGVKQTHEQIMEELGTSSIEEAKVQLEAKLASAEAIYAAQERGVKQSLQAGLIDQATADEILVQQRTVIDAISEQLAILNTDIEESSAAFKNLQYDILDSCESFDEFKKAVENGSIKDVEVLTAGYQKFRNALDEDIDEEEFKNLSKFLQQNAKDLKGVSKELETHQKTAERVAKAILRFDDAVEDINKSYDDWMHALESGNAQEAAEAANEMRETYADLMDLPFDTLSADFLQTARNLELMRDAATGDEEAYRNLQEAVREDILAHVSVDKADWDAQYQALMDDYYYMNTLPTLEVGATIDDADFIAKCNEMIAAAGMTYEQATNFLGSMGVDAELEKTKTKVTRTEYNWHPPVYDVDTIHVGDSRGPGSDYGFPQIAQEGYFEPVTDTAEVEAWAIKTETATKSSGGNFKANNSSAGGGGGKSGGGGGGGSKKTGSAEHAKKQPNDKAGDRYHVINNQIEDLAKQYDKLSEAEERAFGKSRLELMDQKTKLLTKQYQAQQKLRKEAEEYLKLDLKNLQSGSFDSDGDGKDDTFGANRYKDKDGNTLQAILDENGTILNYDELIQAADDYYNAKVDAYNRWLDENYIDKEINDDIEEEKKQLEEQVKNEETYRENFLGLIKQYEDTQDKVQEEINKEIQAYHDVLNQKLENTEYAVQMRIDVDEDSLKLLDFLMKMLEDSPYKAAEAMANLTEQFAVGEDEIEAYKEGLQDLFDNHFSEENGIASKFKETMESLGYVSGGDIVAALTAGGDDAAKLISTLGSMGTEFTDKEIATIRNYSENLQNEVVNLTQIRQDMFEQLDSAINQTNDDLDRQRNKIEKSTKVLEHYDNIIDLIGRDTAGLSTQDMITNAEHQLTVLNAQTAADKAIMDEAQAVYDRLLTEQGMYEENTTEWYLWKQRVEEAEDRLEETTENYYSSWEAALQGIKDKFSQTMELMAEDYSNTLGGTAGNLEGLQNLMDQYEKTHSTYVPEYERVYQLNKLNAEAIKAIDETNNIKAKKQLQEYQQKILEAQESGREMSEYELANLEKELALRQAALGLEEARNVKSQVRMSRDNEGNYSYIYTADEDAVGEAESNYRDKLYEMQKANAEYINEIQNNIVSLQQDCVNAIQQAADIYGEGTAEYENAINKITQYYNDAMAAQFSELELAMANNQSLQEFDAEFHHLMTNDKMVSDTGYITNFKQTLYSELTGIEDSEKANTIWAETVEKARNTAIKAGKDYSTELEKAMNAAGKTLQKGSTDLANFAKSATTEFKKAAKAADNDDEKNPGLKQTIAKLAQDAKDKLLGEDGKGGLVGTVSKFVSSTETAIKNLQTTIAGLTSSLDEVIKKLTGVGNAVDELNKKELNVPSTEGTPSSGDGNTNDTTTPSTSNGNSGNGDNVDNTPYQQPKEEKVEESVLGSDWYRNSASHWKIYISGPKKGQKGAVGEHVYPPGSDTLARRTCTVCGYSEDTGFGERIGGKTTTTQSWGGNAGGAGGKDPLRYTMSAATGAYTGEWGPEGKLAILHEKELVLNEEDTRNMLAAVSMIRQISDVIDLNAQSAGGLFSSLFSANVSMNNEPLEQNVHITAEFPNVTDKDEILAAFDNVINLASQYANRKSPSVNKLSAQLF